MYRYGLYLVQYLSMVGRPLERRAQARSWRESAARERWEVWKESARQAAKRGELSWTSVRIVYECAGVFCVVL